MAVGNPSEVEPEFETPVPLFRPSARINEGFVSLDIVNVQGLRDEVTSSILQRRIPFCHASRVAGDCQWHGVGQPNTDHERLETLHPPPASVADETSERRQGPQEQVVGAGPEVCVRSVDGPSQTEFRKFGGRQPVAFKKETYPTGHSHQRVERAETLVCLGEISAARHALEGSPVAPGTEETLNALRDNDRRPPWPRDPIPEEIRATIPPNPLNWTRMSSSTICEPLGGEQLEALRACATSICAHFSTVLKIVPSSSKSPRLSHRRSFPKKLSPP